MSGWGATLVGLGDALNVLEAVQTRFDGDTVYLAGPTVEYALEQEMGTSEQQARPFVRPAAERVQASPLEYASKIAAAQGIDISDEAGLVRALALAVQNEAKRIADAKDIRDTGQLIASITIHRVN